MTSHAYARERTAHVQAVLFEKSKFSTAQARSWIDAHKYKRSKKVHITEKQLRYRVRKPSDKYKYRTKEIASGIKLVMGYKK